ncbi:MAG: ABC transporter ATP-binding protein, partial [Crocinitomicaceae bacterium]|nr:ABC transporter ATP-binding protein [Crocinitomicaceae bacterium]
MIRYEILENGPFKPSPNVHFHTSLGECAFVSAEGKFESEMYEAGNHESIVWVPPDLLNTGYYTIDVALSTFSPLEVHCLIKGVLGFEVIEDIDKRESEYKNHLPGVVRPKLKWERTK